MDLNEIIDSFQAQPEENDYYGEDGLLYCGICHEPKEAYFPENLRTDTWDRHPCECRCMREQREKIEAEQLERYHTGTVDRLRRICFPDAVMNEWTLDHCILDQKMLNLAQKYIDHWHEIRQGNYGLLLWGPSGTGKTYLSACIANALIEKEVSVRMISLSDIMYRNYNEINDYIEEVCRAELLIIDDFGIERNTSYSLETTYRVINKRYLTHKPLIVSTNLSPDAMKYNDNPERQRISDRIFEMTVPVPFTGSSIRRDIGRNKKDELKSILNS